MQQKVAFSTLFLRRFLKYLLPLLLTILLMTPLVVQAYQMSYEKSLDATQSYVDECLQRIEEQILSTKELSSFLINEKPFLSLMLVKGALQPSDYVHLNQLQGQLARLNLTKMNAPEAFVLFRENNAFISSYISSNDFRTVYPLMLEYQGLSGEEYRNLVMADRFSVRLLPEHQVYSRYYNSTTFRGITCVVNNSPYESIRPSSVLISMIDCGELINGLPFPEQNLLQLSDHTGQLLLAHNYSQTDGLPPAESAVTVEGSHYLLVRGQGSSLGLTMTIGIPREQFYQDILPMLVVVLLYALVGIIAALFLSIFFSFREASSMGGLLETAGSLTNGQYSRQKNEIAYVSSALRQMGDVNILQSQRIQALHDSIRICALENLLVLGVYTQKEEAEILRYFEQDFSFFCVIKCQSCALQLEGGEPTSLLELQRILPTIFTAPPLVLNLYDGEFVAVLFLDEQDSSDLEPVRKRLAELLPTVSGTHSVLNIGMSNIAVGLSHIRGAYLQACYALNIHGNAQVDGVYRYEAARTRHSPWSFDLAIPFKLFDVIISGDDKAVEQIFTQISQDLSLRRPSQTEQPQLFFTLRQAVYNAYVEASRSFPDEEGVNFPDYREEQPIGEQLRQLSETAATICGMIAASRKNSSLRMKKLVEEYVREHAEDPGLCAETIAEKLLISDKYVFSVIKEQTGKSLGRFIEDIRVSKAETLLLTTQESNQRITILCGFGSENTFYRAFSRRHGVSPSVWRKNQLEDEETDSKTE